MLTIKDYKPHPQLLWHKQEILKYIGEDGWLNGGKIENGRNAFGDTPHHTGFLFYAFGVLNLLDEDTARLFWKGLEVRFHESGEVIRNPEDWEKGMAEFGANYLWCNRDQFVPMLMAAYQCIKWATDEDKKRLEVVESYVHTHWWPWELGMQPHHFIAIDRVAGRKRSWLVRNNADLWEYFDNKIDRHDKADDEKLNYSSFIKNYLRLDAAERAQPTCLTRATIIKNAKQVKKEDNDKINPISDFEVYFSRTFEDPPRVDWFWVEIMQMKTLWKEVLYK